MGIANQEIRDSNFTEYFGKGLALIAITPVSGLIYAYGFLSSIDTNLVQIFTVTDLLRFSGSRSAFSALIILSILYSLIALPFTFSSQISKFIESDGRKKIMIILPAAFISGIIGATCTILSAVRVFDHRYYTMISAVFMLFTNVCIFLCIISVTHMISERFSKTLLSFFIITTGMFTIFLFGSIDASSVHWTNEKAVFGPRLCAKIDQYLIEPVLIGDIKILARNLKNQYNLLDTSDSKLVIVEPKDAEQSVPGCNGKLLPVYPLDPRSKFCH